MNQEQIKNSLEITDNQATLPTFMDHVRELQGRLFSIAIIFLIMACIAYPFFGLIVEFLIAPLGDEHELVYLTPGGAFSFIIKVCMYVGAIGSLPFLIYHLYRFLLPVVKPVNIRRALLYTVISMILALVGLSFAYFLSLPAALYFLTSFNLNNINPMLTIDSYFTFIMTYMLAGALLFQLPLVITIINTIKPLTPGGMMKYQRHLILGSFVVAAIISPTPDVLNQTLLAMPVILMYQASIIVVWVINRQPNTSKAKRAIYSTQSIGKAALRRTINVHQPVISTVVSIDMPEAHHVSTQAGFVNLKKTVSVDGFTKVNSRTAMQQNLSRPISNTQVTRSQPSPASRRERFINPRSIDGFMMPTRQL